MLVQCQFDLRIIIDFYNQYTQYLDNEILKPTHMITVWFTKLNVAITFC